MTFSEQLFIRREFQFENIKNLYGVIDSTKKDHDETKVFDSLILAFRQLSQNGQELNLNDKKYVGDLDIFISYESLK